MSALHDFNLVAIVHYRSHITTARRRFPERSQCVESSQRARGPLNSFCFGCNLPAYVSEECIFNFDDALFGAQHFLSPNRAARAW